MKIHLTKDEWDSLQLKELLVDVNPYYRKLMTLRDDWAELQEEARMMQKFRGRWPAIHFYPRKLDVLKCSSMYQLAIWAKYLANPIHEVGTKDYPERMEIWMTIYHKFIQGGGWTPELHERLRRSVSQMIQPLR